MIVINGPVLPRWLYGGASVHVPGTVSGLFAAGHPPFTRTLTAVSYQRKKLSLQPFLMRA